MSTNAIGTTPRDMTLEEWAALPEDTPGELVDGILVEEEVTDWIHDLVVMWLAARLMAWVEPLGGSVGGSGAKFAVSPRRGRIPDLAVYLSGRRAPKRGVIHTPPDLAVEVVSPTPEDQRRDRIEKTREYSAFGIRCYLLVDPATRLIEGFELAPSGRYELALAASDGTVAIPGCDGLMIDLDALWRYLDEQAGPVEADDLG